MHLHWRARQFCSSPNVTAPADADKCDTEAPKKKVEPDDPKIIRKVRQIFYGRLTIRKDRDAGERNNVRENPMSGTVEGNHFSLKHAAIVCQKE